MTKKKILASVNPLIFEGIAHRGLHDKETSENSLNAFKKAIEKNTAIELDVHLTMDNELVVFHDSTLERMTNKSGIVEEKTLKELKVNIKEFELMYSLKHENILKIFSLQFKIIDFTSYSIYVLMEEAKNDWSIEIKRRIKIKKYYTES